MRLGHTPLAARAGTSSVSVRICTGTVLVFVITARNGTSAPTDGAISESWYAASPLASLVLTRSTVMTGGMTGLTVTADVSSSDAVWAGLSGLCTPTWAVFTLPAAPAAGAEAATGKSQGRTRGSL